MIRVGLYRPVHVKTLRSQKLRMLLTHRKLLQSKAIAIENDLRGTLATKRPRKNFAKRSSCLGRGASPRQPRGAEEKAAYRAGTDSGRDL